MKHFLKAAVWTACMIITAVSCSKSDHSLFAGSTGSPLLLSIDEVEDSTAWTKFTYDAKKRISKVEYQDYSAAYQYSGNMVTITRTKTGASQPYAVFTGQLNSKGAVTIMEGNISNNGSTTQSTWEIVYNTEGQAVSCLISDQYNGGPRKWRSYVHTWQGGNLVQTTLSYDGVLTNTRTYTYDTSRANAMATGVADFPEWANAGLTGATNKNLRLQYQDHLADGSLYWKLAYNWTFDSKGLPAACQIQNDVTGNSYTERYRFSQ